MRGAAQDHQIVEPLAEHAAGVDVQPAGERLVEPLDGAVLGEQQAGQRAGIQHARQILGVAGERQPLELALEPLPAQPRVDQAEGAQGRGEVGPVRGRAGDVVDQAREPNRADCRRPP